MGAACSQDTTAKDTTVKDNPAHNARPKAGAGAPGPALDPALTPTKEDAFLDTYKLDKTLGEGQFSIVRKAIDKKTGKEYAVKCIRKASLTEEDLLALVDEVQVMKALDHPNLVKLIDFFSEADSFYLVLELMTGGELFNRIVAKTVYTEREARDLIKVLATAVKYCHDSGVVHRDLKPENILLADDTDEAVVKIADFGFAKQAPASGVFALETACGTPGYVAPEILQGRRYGQEVDVWSLGVIFYILLCGYPPFHDDNQARLFRKIKRAEYEFDPVDWDHISVDAKDLVEKILVVDPAKRLTAKGILEHKWVTSGALPEENMTHTIVQMKKFNARRKLKGAINGVRTVVRMQLLLKGLNAAAAEEAKTAESPAPDGTRV